MSQQQRSLNWALILAMVACIAIPGFFIMRYVVMPWQKLHREYVAAMTEYNDRETDLLKFRKERRKLERYRLMGLPANLEQGAAEYSRYLKNLFSDAGMVVTDFRGPAGLDSKGPSVTDGKKAGHQTLTFQVRALGTWPSIVDMLKQFQKTPLLHRIRSMNLDKQGGNDDEELSVTLLIETLAVNRTKDRPNNLGGVYPGLIAADALLGMNGLPNGFAMALRGQAFLIREMPSRDYAVLAEVNPFIGALPPPPPPRPKVVVAKKEEKKEPPPPPGMDVRPYIKLVLTDPTSQKATLRNALGHLSDTSSSKTGMPAFINLATKKGLNAFQVWDDKRRSKLVDGVVLRVDQRDVYFQNGRRVYGIHIGETLAQAMRKPLSAEDLYNLDLLEMVNP